MQNQFWGGLILNRTNIAVEKLARAFRISAIDTPFTFYLTSYTLYKSKLFHIL